MNPYLTKRQNIISDFINDILRNKPELVEALYNIIPEDCEVYEELSEEVWDKLEEFILKNNK